MSTQRDIEQQYEQALKQYSAANGNTVVAALELCKAVHTAGKKLTKDEMLAFTEKYEIDVVMRKRYVRLGGHYSRLKPFAKSLPSSLRSLYYCSRLSTDDLKEHIAQKRIHPQVSAADLKRLVVPLKPASPQPKSHLAVRTNSEFHVVIELVNDAAFNVRDAQGFLLELLRFLKGQNQSWSCVDPTFSLSLGLKEALAKKQPNAA